MFQVSRKRTHGTQLPKEQSRYQNNRHSHTGHPNHDHSHSHGQRRQTHESSTNLSFRRRHDRRRTWRIPRYPRWRRGFLRCRTLKVESTGTIATMYSKQISSMTISVPLFMWQRKTSVTILLDSGATHNFIDSRTVEQLHLGTRLLQQPLSASNVDGTLNKAGTITHFCNLTIRTKDHSQILSFYIANIGSD
jgi:hypothetical protein